MKTKLLRKVRRRYSITKYTEVNTIGSVLHEVWIHNDCKPFYFIEDTRESLGLRSTVRCKYEDALNYLKSMITNDYRVKVKGEPVDNKEKAWYK